jgi:hypothetical protein
VNPNWIDPSDQIRKLENFIKLIRKCNCEICADLAQKYEKKLSELERTTNEKPS